MKHIAIKTAQMRLIATMLLIMGTISAHAQYYINIRQTNGTRLRYAVSAVDSVWFDKDEQQEPSVNYEYVDLGLSVNWATFNVGATAPEDYGDYFAWGETEPYYEIGYAQSDNPVWKSEKTEGYFPSTNKYYEYSNNSFSLIKYNTDSNYGTVDNKTTLDPEDDVAYVNWGGDWRMPTINEIMELNNSDNCSWTWTTQNGVNGYLVTSKKAGYEGRSIFLPAAGFRLYVGLYNEGSSGNYWSSSLYTYFAGGALELCFNSDDHDTIYYNLRYIGSTVRPVCPSSTYVSEVVASIELDNTEVKLIKDETIQIIATPKNADGVAVTADIQWSSSDENVAEVSATGMILAIGEGNCTITASVGDIKAECVVTVTAPVYEYVDLGLSVNWASFNVGALKPEDYGDYFAWGETEPYYEAGYAQEDPQTHWKSGKEDGYNYATYKWCIDSYLNLTKYNNFSYYGNDGFTDNNIVLDPEDDVAHVKWGGDWRMPTLAEFIELKENCTWEWKTRNGVSGWLVTSNVAGYTDRYIFLPTAGYRSGTGLNNNGFARYWSSTLNTDSPYYADPFLVAPYYAWCLSFDSDFHSIRQNDKYYGYTVRPVCPSEGRQNIVMSMILGDLTAKGDSYFHGAEEWTVTVMEDPDGTPNKVWFQNLVNGGSSSSTPVYGMLSDGGALLSIPVGQIIDLSSDYSSITLEGFRGTEIDKFIEEGGFIYANISPTGIITIRDWFGSNIEHGNTWSNIFKSGVTLSKVKSAVEPEYVDLGLSVKWATFNVGASSPWDFGDYFSWGETEIKDDYSSSIWYNDKSSIYTKYFSDNNTVLDPEDDVAHVKWGGDWRMPTKEEFTELMKNCTWTWAELNGANGYVITSNVSGYTDQFIFLPAAGYRYGTSFSKVGSYGHYWSSSVCPANPHNAWYLDTFNINTKENGRYIGKSVRPVCP